MYDERELLLETFDAHAHLAPDSVDVLARANEIARTHRRTRWVVQATGASLVTAGLVAGGLTLPGLMSDGTTQDRTATVVPASGGRATHYTQQQEFAAFFDAGYVYSDAQQLASLWHETDITKVKTEAGLKLLDGDQLPVAPSGTPAPPEDLAVTAFFNAGYDYNDAVKLASMWHESIWQAKIDGGKKLENGETLPIPPSGGSGPSTPATTTGASNAQKKRMLAVRRQMTASGSNISASGAGMTPALTAYSKAGYDYNDAVRLGKIWKVSTYHAKVEAGKKLESGETLPIQP
jgi:hypothetical protein